MAYDNKNKGALFSVKEKKSDTHADYNGQINIDGKDYYLNGWKKKSKEGVTYLSLSVKPKQSQQSDDF